MVSRILRMLGWSLAALAILACGVVGYEYAVGWRSQQEQERLVARGRALFDTYCARCHGEAMQGHVANAPADAPPLRKPGFAFWYAVMPKDMEGFIAGLIGTGRGRMPPFSSVLTEGDRTGLAAYIHRRNLESAAAP